MIDPFEDRQVMANLDREALLVCLESVRLSEFSDSQLDRLCTAVENLLVDLDQEYFRRDDPPEE
jgi:hypothetical protein